MHDSPSPRWRLSATRELVLDAPRILGILNVTPDSFADGGRYLDPQAAVDAAARMVAEGADGLDIGGVSTRPGAVSVAAEEQIRRVVPVLTRVRAQGGALASIPITIDTTLVSVARAALDAGADAVNDQSAGGEDAGIFALCAQRGAGMIVMHRLTRPVQDAYSDRYEPQTKPQYADVVAEVAGFLAARATCAREAGIPREGIVLDPGLGFGKTVEQCLALMAGTPTLARECPVLSALSRKSFVGRLSLGRDSEPAERLPGTLAASVMHLHAGARIFRVHDVGEHKAALRLAWRAMQGV